MAKHWIEKEDMPLQVDWQPGTDLPEMKQLCKGCAQHRYEIYCRAYWP